MNSVSDHRLAGRLRDLRVEIANKRYSAARLELLKLAERAPRNGEVFVLLGECALAEGDTEAALEAWERAPRGGRFSAQAALKCGEVHLAEGAYLAAEKALDRGLGENPVGDELEALVRAKADLLKLEGRFEDLRLVLRENWDLLGWPLWIVRRHALLDLGPTPLDWLEKTLLDAATKHPEDPRVELARANLLIGGGKPAEAEVLLGACRRRMPDDHAVILAHLDLAMAKGDRALAAESMRRLSVAAVARRRAQAIRVWSARLEKKASGNAGPLRSELEKMCTVDPGDSAAVEELAALELEAGRTEAAAALRERKTKIDEAKHRYRNALLRSTEADLRKSAPELHELAEKLGRRFEADCWRLIAGLNIDYDKSGREEPLDPTGPSAGSTTLAEFVGVLDRAAVPPSVQAPDPAKPPVPRFVDRARSAGLRFVYDNGKTPLRRLPETMSGGVGLIDYDGDGRLDVYFAQGGTLPGTGRPASGDRLFRNRGDGTFDDVSRSSHISALARGYGQGVAVSDYDNDGDSDLFLTRFDAYQLLRNRGDGTFEDVTQASGLGGAQRYPSSAAWGDFDGDGDLDLYVCHYLDWDVEHPRICRAQGGAYSYCDPKVLTSVPDRLWRNDQGRFTDVSESSGIVDRDGRGLGVLVGDFDDDGLLDIFVANDGSANFLFKNLGGMRFNELARERGVAANVEGGFQAGMGIAQGDLDGDGRRDLLVTNLYGECTSYFRNLGGGQYTDGTAEIGLAAATRASLGFGIQAEDFNNDGRDDLAIVNGHVNDFRPLFPYEMPSQLFLGMGSGRLWDVSGVAGECWTVPRLGRGLVSGDLDNDGAIDLVLVSQNQPAAYFHNESHGGHYAVFALEGTRSNRDAVGAVVTIRQGARTISRERTSGGGYESSPDPRLHFGLASDAQISAVKVRWPGGAESEFGPLAPDHAYLLREGAGRALPLKGFSK